MTEPQHASPVISVRGEAKLEVEPEIVYLTVTMTARDKERQRTLAQLGERGKSLRSLLEGYGDAVEATETGRVSIRPERRDRKATEKVVGYNGTVRTWITVNDFSVLGELVARLGDLDMTSVDGPWWGLRHDSPVYRRARHTAARAAVTRAREYADALGSGLAGLIELADRGLTTKGDQRAEALYQGMEAGPPPPGAAFGAAAADAGPPAPPALDLDPVHQIVETKVEARFAASQPAEWLPTGDDRADLS